MCCEHASARLSRARYPHLPALPGGERLGRLAWYELDIGALHGEDHQIVRRRGPREQFVVDRLLHRRDYELIDDQAPVVVPDASSAPDEAGLDTWYREEHVPLPPAVPGWHPTGTVAARGGGRVTARERRVFDFHNTARRT
jgi:hypothetical protein